MKRNIRLGALLLASSAISLASHANIVLLQHWDFAGADPGLTPTQVTGTVSGGVAFFENGGGQATNGSALRISNDGGGANSSVDLTGLSETHLRFEMVISGWHFPDPEDTTRRLSVGFVTSGNLFTANGSIRNNSVTDGQYLSFRTESGGDNSSATIGAAPNMGWDLTRTTPISIRIDIDSIANTYAVFLDEGSGFSQFFSGNTGGRSPDRIRLGAFSGSGQTWEQMGTYIDVSSVSLYAIPEPSTYAAIFGGIALLGALAYRRRARPTT